MLSELKESHCFQIAEYSVGVSVDLETGLNWWKNDSIIALVKKHNTRYLKHTHKLRIECPKTMEDTIELDKNNDNTMWTDVIAKEMKTLQMAFNPVEGGDQPPNST